MADLSDDTAEDTGDGIHPDLEINKTKTEQEVNEAKGSTHPADARRMMSSSGAHKGGKPTTTR